MGLRYTEYLTDGKQKELRDIANALVSTGKGILSADEGIGTMGKRFKSINVENTAEARGQYRQLLFSSDPLLSTNISGVILFHDTVYQKADDGTPLIRLLQDRGIIPGIKVDKSLVPLPGTQDECGTQGLDGLAERCAQYKKDGCHFSKWRCVFKISEHTPSHQALQENAHSVARFAAMSQQCGLVPIVQTEILMEGNHDLSTSQRVAELVLSTTIKALADNQVYLEGCLLKPNMVLAGQACSSKYSIEQNAVATVQAMMRTVPPAIPGILFSSGSLGDLEATMNLNAINKVNGRKPWALTFSFGRALQNSVFAIWHGKKENSAIAQNELLKLAIANGAASQGKFENHMQSSLHNAI